MNQAQVLKVIRILEKEYKYMEELGRSSDSHDRAYFNGQQSALRFAIKTIEAAIKV